MSLQFSEMYVPTDEILNETMELALLHGIYTGIFFVTLWNIFISKSRSIGPAMVAIIILLYITMTINFSFNCALNRSIFFAETFDLVLWGDQVEKLNTGIGVTVLICTVVADCAMIWRCWMVWGRRWFVVLFPILCLASGLGFKISEIVGNSPSWDQLENPVVIYISCIIATTLWCTILIVLRILTVIRTQKGEDGGLRDYRHVIEVLIESSALYSVTLIIYLALEASNNSATGYFDTMAAITTGIAPTLLAGRVAAGHARPDDSWKGSIISSLRFEAQPQAGSQTSAQESLMANNILDNDLEAHREQVDELEEIGTEKRI